MNTKCKHYQGCLETIVLEVFANIGGRTIGGDPNCDTCNLYEPKEETAENE